MQNNKNDKRDNLFNQALFFDNMKDFFASYPKNEENNLYVAKRLCGLIRRNEQIEEHSNLIDEISSDSYVIQTIFNNFEAIINQKPKEIKPLRMGNIDLYNKILSEEHKNVSAFKLKLPKEISNEDIKEIRDRAAYHECIANVLPDMDRKIKVVQSVLSEYVDGIKIKAKLKK